MADQGADRGSELLDEVNVGSTVELEIHVCIEEGDALEADDATDAQDLSGQNDLLTHVEEIRGGKEERCGAARRERRKA